MLGRVVFGLAVVATIVPAAADTKVIDLKNKYGMTVDGLRAAVAEARQLMTHKDTSVVIDLPAGRFDMSAGGAYDLKPGQPLGGVIDVSGIKPNGLGMLTFRGQGHGDTVLEFSKEAIQIYGLRAAFVTFKGITFTTREPTVSQGYVRSATATTVTLDIPAGFPTPDTLFEKDMTIGRYLRRCSRDDMPPRILQENNDQISWTKVEPDGSGWKFTLGRDPGSLRYYRPGELVAIKSKSRGQAYWFAASSDITFDHVIWLRKSRGVFRADSKNVKIVDSQIRRDPSPIGNQSCLSTPDGGPQLGQPNDNPSSGYVVEGFKADGTGDDAIAFFKASGAISKVDIKDSFGRGILLYKSWDVKIVGETLVRAPLLRTDDVAADDE